MWRREERLTYWLEKPGQTKKSSVASEFFGRLSLKLHPENSGAGVQEEVIDIAANACSLDDSLMANACVKDGLSELGDVAYSPSENITASEKQDNCSIRQVNLFRNVRFYDVPLSNEGRAPIRQINAVFAPVCRNLPPHIPASEVQNFITLHSRAPLLRDGSRYLMPPPSVNQFTAKISELPISQISIDIEELADSERSGFLHEAEVLKGIPSDQAKLLAVFRHVPIEMISRLCFLEEKNAILYSIARESRITKTRVHDMAAVRDQQSREIHLIPHRMRFRSVSLN